MANITWDAQKEAKELYDLLSKIERDLDTYALGLGDLRRDLDKAVTNAQYVMDEIGGIDAELDEYHFDDQQAEQQRYEDHIADLADAASY